MNQYNLYALKITRDQFEQLMDDYSDSGYTNQSYSDIIIDLYVVEDHREDFAKIIGLPLEQLPTSGLMQLYP